MNRTTSLSAFLAAALACPVAAQQPSNWTTINLPPGASTPNSIGTTVTFRTASQVWIYSGIRKQWTAIPAKSYATVFQANDYVIVRQGSTFHGYASHTGEVDTIEVNGAATVVSGPASSSWVTLVASGTDLWGFGAFHGHWVHETLNAPNPTMDANRLVGIASDGVRLFALSAHHAKFVTIDGDPSAAIDIVGEAEVATANSPGVLRAFSAQQNTWVVAPVPNPVSKLQSNEFVMVWSGNQAWAVSGLRGNLATYTASGPIGSVSGAEGVAAFVDGGLAVCYGSGRGEFVTRAATSPTFLHEYHFTFVREAGQLTPYSAITGAFGPTITGAYTAITNDAAAWVTSPSASYAYSPVLNAWFPPPPPPFALVAVVRDAVVLAGTDEYHALSARHGNWRTQPVTVMVASAPATGSTFLSIDGAADVLHVFDARLDRWATVTGQGPMTTKISRHTVMAHDGQFGYGFGQPSGEWFVEPLPSPPVAFDTASSIGTLRTATSLSVYSVQGSFTYTGRFPEFTQAINLGNTLRMHQLAAPGSLLLRLFGFAPAYLPLPWGTLYVDPAGMQVDVWPELVDADGFLDLALEIPDDASLVGTQIHLQHLVLPPTGPWWLSSSVAPILF